MQYHFIIQEQDLHIPSNYFIFIFYSITKTGKRTFKGTINHKMRSLMRFYTQFTDIHKHQAINNFLGKIIEINKQVTNLI